MKRSKIAINIAFVLIVFDCILEYVGKHFHFPEWVTTIEWIFVATVIALIVLHLIFKFKNI